MARKDPFDDDDNETTNTPSPEPTDEKPEKLSVEPDPNDDDAEQEGDTEEKKAERRERRKERGTLRAAAEEERRRREDLERQLTEERAARAATEQTARMVAEYARSQAQPQVDPWQQAIENEVQPKRQALMAEHRQLAESGKYTPEEQKRLALEWNKLDQRQQEIITHKALYYRDLQAQQTVPQQEERARIIAANEQIKIRYPDILQNPQAAEYMNLTFMRMTRAEGKPNTWDTGDLAAAETRRAFKMGNRPAPDAATKARYSGVGGGANGHTNGDGKIEMTGRFKKLAESLYPDMPPAKAHKKWAEGPGKKILASEE